MHYTIKTIDASNSTGDSAKVGIEITDSKGRITTEEVMVNPAWDDDSVKDVLAQVARRGTLKEDLLSRLMVMRDVPVEFVANEELAEERA